MDDHRPMVSVTALTPVQGTTVVLGFDDGTSKFVDLAAYMTGPVFDEVREMGLESAVTVDPDLGTVVWPNGADLPPDRLRYENSFQVGRTHTPATHRSIAERVRIALANAGVVLDQSSRSDDFDAAVKHLQIALKSSLEKVASQQVGGSGTSVSVRGPVVPSSGGTRTVTVRFARGNAQVTRSTTYIKKFKTPAS